MKKEKTTRCYLLIFMIFFFLLLVQDAVQDNFLSMKYFDEIFGLLLLPAGVLRLVQKKAPEKISLAWLTMLIFLLVFWLSGWTSTLQYGYQPMVNAWKDAYVAVKFFLAMGASFFIFSQEIDFSWMEKKLWYVCNVVTAVLTGLCILDVFFGIYYTETRYGLPAIKLFYSSYTALVAVCCLLCAIYLRLYEYYGKKIIKPLAALFFIMLNTKRVKALGAMLCILLLYMLVFHRGKKINKKVLVFSILFAGIALVSIVWQIIYYYYQLGDESARLILTIAAPYISKDYFPFGTGWATFGSAFSGEPYSPVYKMYGLNQVWGLSPKWHQFISDTFWPMILVETGVVGLLSYVGAILVFINRILLLKKRNKAVFVSAGSSLAYLLLVSSSESAFVNPLSILFAFWIGFLLAEVYQTGRGKKEC